MGGYHSKEDVEWPEELEVLNHVMATRGPKQDFVPLYALNSELLQCDGGQFRIVYEMHGFHEEFTCVLDVKKKWQLVLKSMGDV